MTVKCVVGKSDNPYSLSGSLTVGKIYEVIAIEHGFYRLIDDSGEDYLYPPARFEIIQK